MTCRERAGWGEAAIRAGSVDYGENDVRTDVVDTIANLLHYATQAYLEEDESHDPADYDELRWYVENVLASAEMHWDAEQFGDLEENRGRVAEEAEGSGS
jgi:hypothetical protein